MVSTYLLCFTYNYIIFEIYNMFYLCDYGRQQNENVLLKPKKDENKKMVEILSL
jgi:hypothetical protein